MSWNAGIIKKRLNPDSTILLQDHNLIIEENNLEERRIDKLRDQDFQEKLSKETMRVPNIRYRVNQILTACEEELENISTLLIGIGERQGRLKSLRHTVTPCNNYQYYKRADFFSFICQVKNSNLIIFYFF